MTEAFSEERLEQLAERWQREPSSRIFVQLAVEYRRGGRLRVDGGFLDPARERLRRSEAP